MQVNCSKCSQPIVLTDSIESNTGRIAHADCTRPRRLTSDERNLLFVYCWQHFVAQCLACGRSFRLSGLAVDPLDGRTIMCPRCRRDLTENVRGHLYACAMLPSEVRLRARAVREAAQRLVKQSQELIDNAEVLIREAEAALFESQQALRAAVKRGPLR